MSNEEMVTLLLSGDSSVAEEVLEKLNSYDSNSVVINRMHQALAAVLSGDFSAIAVMVAGLEELK